MFSFLFLRIDVTVSSVVTFGQPKVTNNAGCQHEAFRSLRLLRVDTQDDMVPFMPTADPYSAM